MGNATWWWVLTGLAVGAELLTGTFYLLMIALGLGAGAVAAHLGAGVAAQLITAGLVGGISVLACHMLRRRRPAGAPAQSNKDVNLDIGETVHVDAWQPDGSASVRLRGATWQAVWSGAADPAPLPGNYRIREIIGNRLILEK